MKRRILAGLLSCVIAVTSIGVTNIPISAETVDTSTDETIPADGMYQLTYLCTDNITGLPFDKGYVNFSSADGTPITEAREGDTVFCEVLWNDDRPYTIAWGSLYC